MNRTEFTENNAKPALHRGFPRRETPSVITLRTSSGERSVTLNPLNTAVAGTLIGLIVFALLGASLYLGLRDDLLGATLSRYARMQHAYEDRIATLRAQVDLVTSRQLLDQKAVENRVATLLARQKEIGQRQNDFKNALTRALAAKAVSKKANKSLGKSPRARLEIGKNTPLKLGSLVGSSTPFGSPNYDTTRFALAEAVPAPDEALFASLETSLENTERAQMTELNALRSDAQTKAVRLAKILSKQGISMQGMSGVGGPLIELKGAASFSRSVDALDASLKTLERVRRAAKSLPHGSPVPGQAISSRFGGRKDPFTGRRAVHGGLDFKARRGVRVHATASGIVTKAGRLGGYGRLVEVDHGGGITTRYAHLSRISVKKGQRIERGQRVGRVGSTGRSTGPHLHYEVRRKGRVLNPIHYVRLEKHIKPYL